FEVNRDGLIDVVTLMYRKDQLQIYYIGIGWQKGGVPELKGTLVSDVKGVQLTEKGYFIYAYKDVPEHAAACQYWRIKPLSDECRELTKKYLSGLSYVNYNMLVTNWNSSNVEDILMPCMFEDIYRIHTGSNFKLKGDYIPAQLYEQIMTNYFPVSQEQLRESCGYDERIDSYPYEMIYASPYAPFGEVVDYTKNSDGTITLVVDGVWPDYNSDCAFMNRIVVQPFLDGTFRYLSNQIEEKELALPFS
ncbi:MAG: ATP F0F1 synthase subunit B, partial [Lachnospiraceae bacterium]|nr:ATP F0F1 synthase subunit B [Lachnospiraceae bacterium]